MLPQLHHVAHAHTPVSQTVTGELCACVGHPTNEAETLGSIARSQIALATNRRALNDSHGLAPIHAVGADARKFHFVQTCPKAVRKLSTACELTAVGSAKLTLCPREAHPAPLHSHPESAS